MNLTNCQIETTAELIQKIRNCNIPRHNFIDERDVTEYFTRHFRHLVPEDLKNMLTNYYYKTEEDTDDIENTMALLDISHKYMQNLEKHLIRLFSSFKSTIDNTKLSIQRTIRQRADFILKLERDDRVDTNTEIACINLIHRLNIPYDIIRYIYDFAFTPILKYTLAKSICGDVSKRLSSMRADNLKKFSRVIHKNVCVTYNYLYTKILPVGSIHNKCNVSVLAAKKIRNNNKKNIIEDILNVLNCIDEIIANFVRRETFPKTLHWLLLKARHIYHSILYVSRHEFNYRALRR